MNIGVATAVWGNYSQYLPDWLASLTNQQEKPDVVTIVDCGADDIGIIRYLRESLPFPLQIIESDYNGFGHARNAAIEATHTEWVMHLDADDILLPNAIADAAELEPKADVVCLGAIIDGVSRTFDKVSAKRILAGYQGSMSPSPYRRELWEQRPYITNNDYVESALWVGFAHLGARFVPTARAGFVYRQHLDSHSKTLPKADKMEAIEQWKRLRTKWEK